MNVLAIDPGNIESAYCLIDCDQLYKPVSFGKMDNEALLYYKLPDILQKEDHIDLAIEMIAYFGKNINAGKSVFDTCVWIGRFQQKAINMGHSKTHFIYRKDEKMNLCGSMQAKDGNIIQALVDRFTPNEPNRGKGTKKNPGWFYGFHNDIWQAYAVGITYLDLSQYHV